MFKSTCYDVSLHSVESPIDSKVKFGSTRIVTIEENGQSKYQSEDDYIKISWDDISYVNEKGQAMRVIHKGIKYIDKNAMQPTFILPKNASMSDILIPTDNISPTGEEKHLFPQYETQIDANDYIGKSVRIVFPLVIQDIPNEYIFAFSIDNATVAWPGRNI